jgi:oligopeptidase B
MIFGMSALHWLRPLLRLLLPLLCGAAVQAQALGPPGPQAERRPHVVTSPHGERGDDYHWLRDDDPRAKRAEVLRHLEAENRHTEAVLAPLRGLRERLTQEMVARVPPDDSSVPVFDGGWWLWRQFAPGVEHPKLMRRRGTPEAPDAGARAEVLLDLPQHAIAQRRYSLGQVQLSPDGQWLAWTEDVLGRGAFDLYLQDLKSRRLAPERIRGVLEGIAWAADSRTLFYVRQDPVTLHSGVVWRHVSGTDPGRDVKVYDEADPTLFVAVRASASRRQLLIDIVGSQTTELRAVPADDPAREPAVIVPRRPGVRVHADHVGGRWLLRTNDGAPDFRLLEAPDPALPEGWRTLLPAREDVALEGFQAFDDAIVVEERLQARRRVRVLGPDGRERRVIDGGPAVSVALGEYRDARAAWAQVVRQSLVQPPATIDVHLASGRAVLRRQEVVKGHDPALHRTRQLWAPVRDGTRVPVTLAWRESRVRRDGSAPLLIEAYGAYGESYEPTFGAHRLSLLDRGFVIAIAHVRGGGEGGRAWYEAARRGHKQRSFDDFVDVTAHLVAERWGAPDKVFAHGASAGGLLLAAVANQAGMRYRGLALDMPFVDVLSSLLDPTLPLTAPERDQWGDPREKPAYDALRAWSPYDNIAARAYPAMLVTTALWDTRVPFHEPAKYVARLRATKTDRNPLLLHVEMDAGHDGAAGRLERQRQWARQYAFFLELAGLATVAAPAPDDAAALIPHGDVSRGIKLTR